MQQQRQNSKPACCSAASQLKTSVHNLGGVNVAANAPPSPGSGDPPGWWPVRKRRRISRFSLDGGQIVARGPGLGQQPRCEVELTEVHTHGQHWWTLGFEATGPADLLRSELEATAALVFADPLPGVEAGPDESRFYAEWLSQRPGAER